MLSECLCPIMKLIYVTLGKFPISHLKNVMNLESTLCKSLVIFLEMKQSNIN